MNPAELSIPADLDNKLSRLQMRAVIVSVLALILVIIGAVMNPPVFFRGWLMAWLLWLGVALGSLALQMLQFLSGGQWGVVSRRVFEAAGQTLPLLAILFIPILFGMGTLYPWTHPDLVAGDAVLQHKHAYLNVPFFVIRAILYFVIWIGTAILVSRAGDHQDEPGARSRASAYSGLGLVLYFFTMTFAATDWAQSLQPHWYSTIWGFLFIVGQGLSAMSLGICAILLLAQWPPMRGIVRERHMHDLGKLLFMFVMLWAYLSFSQLLIIWAGNLPEEIPWYVERLATNWAGVAVALLLFQFLFPFLLLLSRPLKRHAFPLMSVAILLFVMRQVDVFWMIVPDAQQSGIQLHWLHFVCPIAIGAGWIAFWIWQVRRKPLLPGNDPRFAEVIAHG
jgi:hypothetical protein